jgi:hypothetical protein
MRFFAVLLAGLLCSAVARADDDSARTTLISRIAIQYYTIYGIRPDSPVLNLMLSEARKLNPTVDEDGWRDIKAEVAPAVIAGMIAKGAAFDAYFNSALDTLSLAELRRLSNLLGDPVYVKFAMAMTSPENQRQMLAGIVGGDPMTISRAINGVLERRGLNVPH